MTKINVNGREVDLVSESDFFGFLSDVRNRTAIVRLADGKKLMGSISFIDSSFLRVCGRSVSLSDVQFVAV